MARANINDLKKNSIPLSEVIADTSNSEQEQGMSELTNLIKLAYFHKQAKESSDSKYKEATANLVDMMKKFDLSTLNVNGIKCTLSQRENRSCNEEGLLEYCKTISNKVPNLVKTVEVVDLDVLTDALYNNLIDSDGVEQFYTKSITESIRISGKPKE